MPVDPTEQIQPTPAPREIIDLKPEGKPADTAREIPVWAYQIEIPIDGKTKMMKFNLFKKISECKEGERQDVPALPCGCLAIEFWWEDEPDDVKYQVKIGAERCDAHQGWNEKQLMERWTTKGVK